MRDIRPEARIQTASAKEGQITTVDHAGVAPGKPVAASKDDDDDDDDGASKDDDDDANNPKSSEGVSMEDMPDVPPAPEDDETGTDPEMQELVAPAVNSGTLDEIEGDAEAMNHAADEGHADGEVFESDGVDEDLPEPPATPEPLANETLEAVEKATEAKTKVLSANAICPETGHKISLDGEGGTVECPPVRPGISLLDCPFPEFHGYLKVKCKNGVASLIEETCAWRSTRDVLMGLQAGQIQPAVIRNFWKEAVANAKELKLAKTKSTRELDYVRHELDKVTKRALSSEGPFNETLKQLQEQDSIGVELDKRVEEATGERERWEEELGNTSSQLEILRQKLDDSVLHEPKTVQARTRALKQKAQAQEQLRAAYWNSLDALRDLHAKELDLRKGYAEKYDQMLDMDRTSQADESEGEALQNLLNKTSIRVANLTIKSERADEFAKKLTLIYEGDQKFIKEAQRQGDGKK